MARKVRYAEEWHRATARKAGNFRTGAPRNPIDVAADEYVSGLIDVQEFESRVAWHVGLTPLRLAALAREQDAREVTPSPLHRTGRTD